MLILHALFLWLMVSTLMIGGAVAFHRRFPEESPWFGFIIPPLALVVLFNFIEHGVALPVLYFLMPLLLIGSIWLIAMKKWFARPLIVPSIVFLASFAFTFAVRCIRPDILFTSDGISDLNMVNNFSQGQTLPPPDTWMPPLRFEWYYDLQHYAASIMERLLKVHIGEAYNVCHALLSALICVAGTGAAWRLSGGKIWVALAMPFIIESAMTGCSAYLLLTSKNPSVDLFPDLSGGMVNPPDSNPIWKWLFSDLPPQLAQMKPDEILNYQTLRLQVPGFWTWRDEYHANASGHFLTLLAIMTIAELAETRRTIWPWVMAAITPLFAVLASAWALPITALLCWVTLPLAWFCGRRPTVTGTAVITLFIALAALWPAFSNATSSPQVPDIHAIDPLERVPLYEFLVQWWPIILLWIGATVCIKNTSFGVRWVMIVLPIMLKGIEQIDIESRYNMIEKMWGYTWGAGLVALFPLVAARANLFCRVVTILVLFSALVTLSGHLRDLSNSFHDPAMFHLEGDHYITADTQKRKMLEKMQQIHQATFLTGKSDTFCYYESPALTAFTGNSSYIAWWYFELNANNHDEAITRRDRVKDFYAGTMTDRLRFLNDNKLAGVFVWPDDEISDAELAKLHADLDTTFDYFDCKGDGQRNAGIFLRRATP